MYREIVRRSLSKYYAINLANLESGGFLFCEMEKEQIKHGMYGEYGRRLGDHRPQLHTTNQKYFHKQVEEFFTVTFAE